MKLRDNNRVAVEEVLADAAALGDAMLANDIDEARFLALRIAMKGTQADVPEVASAAQRPTIALGPVGTYPGMGFGSQLLALADALRRIGAVSVAPPGRR